MAINNEVEDIEIPANKARIAELESQGWIHYSNYLNPDLLLKAQKRLGERGFEMMTSDEAFDCAGRTSPDPDAVSLWYKKKN